MSEIYRFSLKKGRQISCPSCGKAKFSPYIDLTNNVALNPDLCGRCSRENNCGYHFTPRELFAEYPEYIPKERLGDRLVEIKVVKEVNLIEEEIFANTLFVDEENTLYKFLKGVLPEKNFKEAAANYMLGFQDGMIIFWQIDSKGDIRTGKKMMYHENGKRDKDHLYLMHNEIYDGDFTVKECFFGEHLINQFPNKTIQIVESEKSAIICSSVWPEFIWLSTGGKNKWLEGSWDVLEDKSITLVPDEDAILEWKAMKEAMEMVGLNVSIDNVCKGGKPQCDIADLILESF